MNRQTSNSGQRRLLSKFMIIGLLVAAALVTLTLGAGAVQAQEGATAATTARLNFREGPTLDAAIIRTLPVGAEVTFTGFEDETGNWVQVEADDGTVGWVFDAFLTNVPDTLELVPATADVLTPSITVVDQAIGGDGAAVVPQVVATDPGWVVIHRNEGGEVGAVIGQTFVDAGVSNDVVVALDTDSLTERLFAMLHVDTGEAGVYEFPGADGPVTVDGNVVVEPFLVTDIAAFTGEFFAPNVVTAETTVNLNLRRGPGVGFTIIETLPQGTVVGFTGFMDADGDWVQVDPVGARVGWVAAQFLSNVPEGLNVIQSEVGDLTPSISVEDQLVGDDGMVTVPEVVAVQPGWVVIHRDDGGAPGAVIGQAQVDAGVSVNVMVPINADMATETIYAMLHVDEGEAGVYEFPGADGPATVDGNVVVRPFELEPQAVEFGPNVVTASTTVNLNLRAGPGLDYDVIDVLPQGSVVGFTGFTDTTGQWVQVDPASGPLGWVFADFLSNVPGGLQVAEDLP